MPLKDTYVSARLNSRLKNESEKIFGQLGLNTAEAIRIFLHQVRIYQTRKKGQMIGAHDLIIAATAVSLKFSLVTNNRKIFERIPNLKLIEVEPT